MQPRQITATGGHRDGQIGLAVERRGSGYFVRFYDVHRPRTTDAVQIMRNLEKGFAASLIWLDESEFVFNEA